ncbi:MAG: FG-GAP-like repeat-containing protein [Acidobacteriota bacterium]
MNTYEARIKPLAYWFGRQTIRLPHWLTIVATVALVFGLVYQVEKLVISATPREATNQPEVQRATMSDEISVHAAGRGNPWINLSNGHELITPYSGPAELTQVLERNEARPLSLCSADFDEDGVPDLISGYAGPNVGIITLLRGNVDSIYPNASEAKQRKAEGTFTDAPFLSPAFVFGVPESADFIGAGDFDGDSHWDVVAAARGSTKLYLMSGNGKGGLRQTKRIDLPGGVTAMVVGDINRRDGLDDVVVGVSGEQGAKVLVFEGPEGALRASTEAFGLPAEATSLALGQLDDRYEVDLAIAAGHELMIVHGRDRKLSLDKVRQQEVAQATVEERVFPSGITSVVIGDFSGNHESDLALLSDAGTVQVLSRPPKSRRQEESLRDSTSGLSPHSKTQPKSGVWQATEVFRLSAIPEPRSPNAGWHLVCARVSSHPADTLLVVNSLKRQVQIFDQMLSSTAAANFGRVVALESATLDFDGEATVVLPMRLNADALSDLVTLGSTQSAPTVALTQAVMTFTVTNTNDSGPGSLRQAILDANANPGADAIIFGIGAGAQTIMPTSALPAITDSVSVDATTQPGFAGTPIVELAGTNAGVDANGLLIRAGGSLVRGLVINRFIRDSLAASTAGVIVQGSKSSVIEGNFIDTDVSGSISIIIGNHTNSVIRNGVLIDGSSDNLIGGTVPGARNVIATNDGTCVQIMPRFGSLATRNRIQGNFIGTDKTGTVALSVSRSNGVLLIGFAGDNLIGGTTTGARNLIISGSAIYLGPADGTLIQGNFIGTDITGTMALRDPFPISYGVSIFGDGNTVGGTTPAARNLISGQNTAGIVMVGSLVTQSLVQGNYIGTDVTGTHALSNSRGVFITDAPDNTIGGSADGAGNLISGNDRDGVAVGIREAGVAGGTGISILGNFIGTDAGGTADLGNGLDGVFIDAESVRNLIALNHIAFNKKNGITIPNNDHPAVEIKMLSNLIHDNSLLGIDLGPTGVTRNPFNSIKDGANRLQNFPDVASAELVSNSTGQQGALAAATPSITVAGTLSATPNTAYTIQFFFGSSCNSGQGHQFIGTIPVLLGTTLVTTDGSGITNYNVSLPLTATATSGGFVNATATDPVGNTSELSGCTQVTGTVPVTGPTITRACKGDGKQLIINGVGFVDGAKVVINGAVEKKTQFVSFTQVIAFKAGKRTFTGDILTVRNPGGVDSQGFSYTRVDCQ